MGRDYLALEGIEIGTLEGPGGHFSMYRDNPGGLPTGVYFVEKQVTATLAKEGYPELYAVVGPADYVSFVPSWASVEEEESGEFPGAYSYEQWGEVLSQADEGFSATFKYLMQPLLTNNPETDDLEDAVFETEDGECTLIIEDVEP